MPPESLNNIIEKLKPEKSLNKKSVFAVGVFDLFDVKHLRYLEEAADRGDLLVVGVLDDDSAREGDKPIVPAADRLKIVSAMEPVDFAFVLKKSEIDFATKAIVPDFIFERED